MRIKYTLNTPLERPEQTTYNFVVNYDEEINELQDVHILLEHFFAQEGSNKAQGIVIGYWIDRFESYPREAINLLKQHAPQLTNLSYFHLGDISPEEDDENIWLIHEDYGELLSSLPSLETFILTGRPCGFSDLKASQLKEFRVYCKGFSSGSLKDVLSAYLPQLEHLELYLGVEDYGADFEMSDFVPLLSGEVFPKLKFLGLRNSERQDEIAQLVANSPILERIEVLDLGGGTLTDEGAQALLNSDSVKKLKQLVINYHYMSHDMCQKLEALSQYGVKVILSEPEEADEEDGAFVRYVNLSEYFIN